MKILLIRILSFQPKFNSSCLLVINTGWWKQKLAKQQQWFFSVFSATNHARMKNLKTYQNSCKQSRPLIKANLSVCRLWRHMSDGVIFPFIP